MKKLSEMSEMEIKTKLVKYLNEKGIDMIINDNGKLIWTYEPHYSKFEIRLNYTYKNENDNDPIIFYSPNTFVNKDFHRRKTSINNSYCLKVYRNLQIIKEEYDKIAVANKRVVDTKTKYCTELEKYYERLYDRVDITTSKQIDDTISISISCYNGYTASAFYNILFKNNKYYITHKVDYTKEIFMID
jgi:hypothetical protein